MVSRAEWPAEAFWQKKVGLEGDILKLKFNLFGGAGSGIFCVGSVSSLRMLRAADGGR